MEELLEVLGFGIGASITISAFRAMRRGIRATAVQVTRSGLGVGDAFRRLGEEARKLGDEARAEVHSKGEQPATRRGPRRGEKSVRTIEVAQ